MEENEFEDYDREAELALYREYRDVVGTFKYVIETERRFYLANEVELQRVDTVNDFYFELNASNSQMKVMDYNQQVKNYSILFDQKTKILNLTCDQQQIICKALSWKKMPLLQPLFHWTVD